MIEARLPNAGGQGYESPKLQETADTAGPGPAQRDSLPARGLGTIASENPHRQGSALVAYAVGLLAGCLLLSALGNRGAGIDAPVGASFPNRFGGRAVRPEGPPSVDERLPPGAIAHTNPVRDFRRIWECLLRALQILRQEEVTRK